jgi:hypothetical protein
MSSAEMNAAEPLFDRVADTQDDYDWVSRFVTRSSSTSAQSVTVARRLPKSGSSRAATRATRRRAGDRSIELRLVTSITRNYTRADVPPT